MWFQADVLPAAERLPQWQQVMAPGLLARMDAPEDAFRARARHGARGGGWLNVSLVRDGSIPADVPQAFREQSWRSRSQMQ